MAPVNKNSILKKILDELTVEDRVTDLPTIAKEVCEKYLANKDFISSSEWAQAVEHLVTISLTFEEVSAEVYGKSVPFLDDEGWLCQGWENYTWLHDLVEILSTKDASDNPEWERLLILIMKVHKKYNESIDYLIEELFEQPWVQEHKSFEKLKDAANEFI